MKQGLNLLISGLLLWISAEIIPETVVIDGFLPLIFATIIFYVLVVIVSALSILFFTPVTYRNAPILQMFVVCFVVTTVIGALVLRFLCPVLDGFSIGSFWIALIISAFASTLSFSAQLSS